MSNFLTQSHGNVNRLEKEKGFQLKPTLKIAFSLLFSYMCLLPIVCASLMSLLHQELLFFGHSYPTPILLVSGQPWSFFYWYRISLAYVPVENYASELCCCCCTEAAQRTCPNEALATRQFSWLNWSHLCEPLHSDFPFCWTLFHKRLFLVKFPPSMVCRLLE